MKFIQAQFCMNAKHIVPMPHSRDKSLLRKTVGKQNKKKIFLYFLPSTHLVFHGFSLWKHVLCSVLRAFIFEISFTFIENENNGYRNIVSQVILCICIHDPLWNIDNFHKSKQNKTEFSSSFFCLWNEPTNTRIEQWKRREKRKIRNLECVNRHTKYVVENKNTLLLFVLNNEHRKQKKKKLKKEKNNINKISQ